jgi:hypothetical protein
LEFSARAKQEVLASSRNKPEIWLGRSLIEIDSEGGFQE